MERLFPFEIVNAKGLVEVILAVAITTVVVSVQLLAYSAAVLVAWKLVL